MSTSLPPVAYLPSTGGVDITLRRAVGVGRTRLAAFDHALLGAGIADRNLIVLSSVIPPGSQVRLVEDVEAEPIGGGHGDRLFCVLAAAYAEAPGQEAWAGVGWVVDEATGAGLFVEHVATTEAELEHLIHATLGDMVVNRGGGYGPVQSFTTSARFVDRPTAALTVAAYTTIPWSTDVR